MIHSSQQSQWSPRIGAVWQGVARHDAARGLRALLHPAAVRAHHRCDDRQVRGHDQRAAVDVELAGQVRKQQLLRRRPDAAGDERHSPSGSTATIDKSPTCSTRASSGARCCSRHSTTPTATSTASSSRQLPRRRIFRPTRISRIRRRRAGTSSAASTTSTRTSSPTSRATSSISTTTRRGPARLAPRTCGMRRRSALR